MEPSSTGVRLIGAMQARAVLANDDPQKTLFRGDRTREIPVTCLPDDWAVLAGAVLEPARAVDLSEAELSGLLDGLEREGLVPLFAKALAAGPGVDALEPVFRDRLERSVARYKAAAAALWDELERLLTVWRDGSLVPCLLKGSHLAAACYDSPHLRPMSDVDALFLDLGEAERAYELAQSLGYAGAIPPMGRDPWLFQHELPVLSNAGTGFHLEVHGSVLYPPGDRRWRRFKGLAAEQETFEYGEFELRCLKPEANLVYLLAHNLVQHGLDGPKLQTFFDVEALLDKAGDSFQWDRADRTGRSGRVGAGPRRRCGAGGVSRRGADVPATGWRISRSG